MQDESCLEISTQHRSQEMTTHRGFTGTGIGCKDDLEVCSKAGFPEGTCTVTVPNKLSS